MRMVKGYRTCFQDRWKRRSQFTKEELLQIQKDEEEAIEVLMSIALVMWIAKEVIRSFSDEDSENDND